MKVKSNKIHDIVKYYHASLLEIFGEGEARSLVRLVFSHFLSFPANELALHYEDRVAESDLLKLHFAFKDLLKQRPLQYILGETSFFDLDFYIHEGVLIPRPETEELVEWILASYSKEDKIRILDVGTGSGCIGITLASHLPNAEVVSIDVSDEALGLGQRNAERNQVKMEFLKRSALDQAELLSLGHFDVIVSNPPYVRNLEKAQMQKNVLDYEPDLALFVSDDDPLIFYRAICLFAEKNLNKDGSLFFEINEYLGEEMLLLMQETHLKNLELRKDFRGRDRMLLGKK